MTRRSAPDDAPRVLDLALPRRPEAAARARRSLQPLVAALAGEDDVPGDLLLVVSELVTNAVVHGEGEVRLEVRLEPAAVLVAVSDEGRGEPVRRPRSTTGQGGRGVALVDAVCSAWGVVREPGGKRVWARLARPVPRSRGVA